MVAILCARAAVFAQNPSPTPSPNDVEALRQQVQALTETVKALQQQVKEQQETLAKMSAGPAASPANESASAPPAPSGSAAPVFPTTDESVVATTAQPTPIPAAAAGACRSGRDDRTIPDDRRLSHDLQRRGFGERCGRVADRADDDHGRRKNLHEYLLRQRLLRSPIRPMRISISSRLATTIRSSAVSMRATQRLRSTAQSIPYFEGFRQHRFETEQRQRNRDRAGGSFCADDRSAVGLAGQIRSVLCCLRSDQSDPSPHLGFRGRSFGQRPFPRV